MVHWLPALYRALRLRAARNAKKATHKLICKFHLNRERCVLKHSIEAPIDLKIIFKILYILEQHLVKSIQFIISANIFNYLTIQKNFIYLVGAYSDLEALEDVRQIFSF